MLTVDTHHPDGYKCEDCEDIYENPYANVLTCSDKRICEFLDWLKEQDFYEDTTIVVTGDHCSMNKSLTAEIDSSYGRKTLSFYINPAAENKAPDKFRDYSTLDLFPTTIAALGADIEGDKLGLGVNLFSGNN